MALNELAEREAALRAERLRAVVGHPGELVCALLERIRGERIRDFAHDCR
jgi:hypothetical protein